MGLPNMSSAVINSINNMSNPARRAAVRSLISRHQPQTGYSFSMMMQGLPYHHHHHHHPQQQASQPPPGIVPGGPLALPPPPNISIPVPAGFNPTVSLTPLTPAFVANASPEVTTTTTQPNVVTHSMFLARVLTGTFCVGRSDFKRPPEMPGSNGARLYDSCVDNLVKPSIFVVFENTHSYPEYLIEYTEKVSPGVATQT